MSAAIEIHDLHKTYRSARATVKALNGVEMDVQQGEIYGFIGVNGAGKSTTIKILLGFIKPGSGSATIFGLPCGSLASRRQVGYLPEVAQYHEFMTADELLRVHAALAGIAVDRRGARCAQALESVGLGERAGSRISEFSKGMKQRFGVAQALIGEPPVLILDELTSGLDPFAQHQLKDIMLELRRKGITIFFSSHQMSEVESICDRAGIIHRGKIRACGTVEELLSRRGKDEIEFFLEHEDVKSILDSENAQLSPLSQEGRYTVEVPVSEGNLLLDRVRSAGGRVVRFGPARASLEEVFHDLVVAVDREESLL